MKFNNEKSWSTGENFGVESRRKMRFRVRRICVLQRIRMISKLWRLHRLPSATANKTGGLPA